MSTPTIQAEVFGTEAFQLGEGPVWHGDWLWWVDIEGCALCSASPEGDDRQRWDLGQRVGFAVPGAEPHQFLVGLQNGVAILDLVSGALEHIADPEPGLAENRINDGKLGPRGRIVFGTLNMVGRPQAAGLYSLGQNGVITRILAGVTLSNGLAWSADGQTLYFIDTPTYEIAAFDYDLESGTLSNRRVVVRIPREMGGPDGMTIDAAGNLWVGHWDGYAVRCWSPQSGECLASVPVPCPAVTSCCFGGPMLDTLYITTARIGTPPDQLESYPLSGNVFLAKSGGVRGCPALPGFKLL